MVGKAFVPLLFLVAACSTAQREAPEPVIQIQRVEVPVPVPCNARQAVGPRQTFPDSDANIRSAPNLAERIKLLLIGRERRETRIDNLEDAVDAC